MGAAFILEGGVSLRGGPLGHIVKLRIGDLTYRMRITEQWERDVEAQSVANSRHTHVIEFLDYREDDREHDFDHVPYEDDRFAWTAGYFMRLGESTITTIHVLVSGEQIPVQRDQLRQIDMAAMAGPIWCPVANMKAERPYGPGGKETKRGSKHFKPGARLYCDPGSIGGWYDQIKVVGHHRASHRFVTMIVSSSWLTNWRLELAYSPYVIRAFWPRWDGTPEGKERAQEIVDMMREREREAAEQPEAPLE